MEEVILQDCGMGKKMAAAADYIDTGRIGINGGSYGGCMTLCGLAFYPDEFKSSGPVGVANWLLHCEASHLIGIVLNRAFTTKGRPNQTLHQLKNFTNNNYQKIKRRCWFFSGK